jgi:hypothetical protein
MNRLLCMLAICNLGILYWPGSESRSSQAEGPRMWPGFSSRGRGERPSLSGCGHVGIPGGRSKCCGVHRTTKMPLLDKILCMQQPAAPSSRLALFLSNNSCFSRHFASHKILHARLSSSSSLFSSFFHVIFASCFCLSICST